MVIDESVGWLATQQAEMEAALEALVAINSFSANVDGGTLTGETLDRLMAHDGLTASAVAAPGHAPHRVYRSTGRAGVAPVAILGHLDTVFPPGVFEGYRVDGALRRGPGVLDMKGGLVVVAWALRAIARGAGLAAAPPLEVVIVSDEEVGSPSGAPLIRERIAGCSAALVLESGRPGDAVVTRRKGTAAVTLTATGVPAHAGNAYFQGHSAIWGLARVIDRIQGLSSEAADITVNVGLVSGGTSRNTVPATARAEVDVRARSVADLDTTMAAIAGAAAESGVAGVTVQAASLHGRPPMSPLPGTARLLEHYRRCALESGLLFAEADVQGGGSDGNTATAMGIPAIDGLGPRGRGFHTPDEHIEVSSLVPKAMALARFLLTWS